MSKNQTPQAPAADHRPITAHRHGFTGQTVVLPSDDLTAYQRHCREFHDQYHPKNKMEVQLTQTLADLTWRLNRITAIETNMLTLSVIEHPNSIDTENDQVHSALVIAKAFYKQSQTLSNLSLYERRLSLRFKETLKQLNEMQANRQYQERSATSTPATDGFVFSNSVGQVGNLPPIANRPFVPNQTLGSESTLQEGRISTINAQGLQPN